MLTKNLFILITFGKDFYFIIKLECNIKLPNVIMKIKCYKRIMEKQFIDYLVENDNLMKCIFAKIILKLILFASDKKYSNFVSIN